MIRLGDIAGVRATLRSVKTIYNPSVPCPKHAHKSEGAAHAQIRAMVQKQERGEGTLKRGDALRVYRCGHCRQWHVGRLPS